MNSAGDITRLLVELRQGSPDAADRLVPLVYKELRSLAAAYMRRERSDHTIQATALVHEAYMRLIQQHEKNWQNRAHFFGVAAHLMRNILVDHARRHCAAKHGGAHKRVPLDKVNLFSEEQYDELIALDEALVRLAKLDERMVRIVELRFFADLTVDETAEALGIAPRTVKRDWQVARSWLSSQLESLHTEAASPTRDIITP